MQKCPSMAAMMALGKGSDLHISNVLCFLFLT